MHIKTEILHEYLLKKIFLPSLEIVGSAGEEQ